MDWEVLFGPEIQARLTRWFQVHPGLAPIVQQRLLDLAADPDAHLGPSTLIANQRSFNFTVGGPGSPEEATLPMRIGVFMVVEVLLDERQLWVITAQHFTGDRLTAYEQHG